MSENVSHRYGVQQNVALLPFLHVDNHSLTLPERKLVHDIVCYKESKKVKLVSSAGISICMIITVASFVTTLHIQLVMGGVGNLAGLK